MFTIAKCLISAITHCASSFARRNSKFLLRINALIAASVVLFANLATGAELRVVSQSFPGIFERDASGKYSGYGVDALRAVCAELQCTLHFDLLPWARAIRDVTEGDADLLIGSYRTAEREQMMVFARAPLYRDEVMFFARRGSTVNWSGELKSLGGVRIGINHGWIYTKNFEAARSRLKLIDSNDIDTNIRHLNLGSIDLFASTLRDTNRLIRSLGMQDRLIALKPPIGHEDAWITFSHSSTSGETRDAIDDAFERLGRSGKLNELARRHGVTLPKD